MTYDMNTLADAIEFAKKSRSDCTMLVLFVAHKILEQNAEVLTSANPNQKNNEQS